MEVFKWPEGTNGDQAYTLVSNFLIEKFGEDVFAGTVKSQEFNGITVQVLNGIIVIKKNVTAESIAKLKNYYIKSGAFEEGEFKCAFNMAEFVEKIDKPGYYYVNYLG
jgi:hypothetical protein